jgi:hypothetical protein
MFVLFKEVENLFDQSPEEINIVTFHGRIIVTVSERLIVQGEERESKRDGLLELKKTVELETQIN